MTNSSARDGCFQYVKVTKMKANHNGVNADTKVTSVVSNTSKLLK